VGDPLPPFIRVPEAVKDLSATQSGNSIVLTWTNPAQNIDGSAATNLAHVQIRSNRGPVATVNAGAAGKPQSYPMPVGQPDGEERRFTLVVDTTQGKLSAVSNSASVSPVQVPGSVTRLRAYADQRKVIVEWDRPLEHPELADAYVVTRTDPPDMPETVSDTRYVDLQYQPGKMFTYQVTPIRRVSGVAVAGVGSESYTVMIEDKAPPKAPAGLDLIKSDKEAILTWDPNSETDLAGYRVYRSERAGGPFTLVSGRLITTNLFSDTGYKPGFYYSVSAEDEFGNESPKSAAFPGP
jgi:fibronectin type 3 domain-containing protein